MANKLEEIKEEVMVTKITTQNRWKSPVLWTGLISAVIAFLLGSGLIDVGLSQTLTNTLAFVLTVLASFGIINSPTNKGSL